jgi:SAM-dependent methyltransferase
MLSAMIDIGQRTGLFEVIAAGPGTSAELATRAGLQERYVREWLGAMATSRIVDYQASDRTYALSAEHAACLTGGGSANLAPLSRLNTDLTKHVPAVARAFVEGGGVPYDAYRPDFTDTMDLLGRGVYDEQLIDAWLRLAPGLTERLTNGARAADVGCGTGHAVNLLARRFPSSTFVGYDIAEDAIGRARSEAASEGLRNARFEACDAARLRVEEPFDVVFVFDAIHDQVAPAGVLRRIWESLTPGGVFFMKEPRVSSELADNIGNPFAPMLYAFSTLHCLTVSLAENGAGLGTAWGEQLALSMLDDAGFTDLSVHEAAGDPMDAIFISRRPE